MHTRRHPSYIINLDPATGALPYDPNIDIRQAVNYKEVMKQYVPFLRLSFVRDVDDSRLPKI